MENKQQKVSVLQKAGLFVGPLIFFCFSEMGTGRLKI